MTSRRTASDASYHSRHSRRSQKRAECIASKIAGPVRVLDVGCNIGITSMHLLHSGIATRVTGIELSKNTVNDALLHDSRFELIEGDIVSITPERDYEVVVYGAVHHHVMNHHGLGAAVSVLQNLACCCTKSLFFETGQLSEGGRWDWQRSIRRYFRTDEEHFHYLLGCIEPAIARVEVIGKFWIHGIRRSYLKIDLKPREARDSNWPNVNRILMVRDRIEYLGRTFGSRRQVLRSSTDPTVKDSPVQFANATTVHGAQVFMKRHVHLQAAASHEYQIGAQIPHDWAIKSIGIETDSCALVFPLVIDASSIPQMAGRSRSTRLEIANSLLRIWATARLTEIDVDRAILFPTSERRSMLDLCDLNVNNVLIKVIDNQCSISIVDFEQHGLNCRHRNRVHLGKMLLQLRCYRGRALALFGVGYFGLVWLMFLYQFRPFKQRIVDRQPAIGSVAVTEVRSVAGKIFRRILRLTGIE